MKTIIIFSHPNFQNSKINRALIEAVKGLPDLSVRHLEAIYGTDTSKIDPLVEIENIKNADRIVFQFPMFWLNVPPMLKAYIDSVITMARGRAIDENILQNKELQIAVSVGVNPSEYSKQGTMKFSVGEILLPLQIMANYCAMRFNRVFISGYLDSNFSDEAKNYAQRYVKLLKNELKEHEYQL